MSYGLFGRVFNEILCNEPLPYEHHWRLERMTNDGLQKTEDWFEVLYRTRAKYQCDDRHSWQSSWSMTLFRFRLNPSTGKGVVRMRRFGLCCNKCTDDYTYYNGICDYEEIWYQIQRLLLNILQRCYEGRRDCDVDTEQYIMPVNDVPPGNFGGAPHPKALCEACAHNRCQELYKELTKKK